MNSARLRPLGFAGHHASPFEPGVAQPRQARRAKRGGARRDRTADLVIANDALSQLSYGPSAGSPDTSQGQPAVGAIYNPRQGQVKNAEIVVFRAFGPDFPCLGGGEPIFTR
jgi:hypothetical protein